MRVIKIGGGSLAEKEQIGEIVRIILQRGRGNVVVLSGLGGVTDSLAAGIERALVSEENIAGVIQGLREMHLPLLEFLVSQPELRDSTAASMEDLLSRLERLYFGLTFTGEVTPRLKDMIMTFGERLSVMLFTGALKSKGVETVGYTAEEIGIISDGQYGSATALMKPTRTNLRQRLLPAVTEDRIVLVTGYFGVNTHGCVTTFGRGGSDYSAAVVAAALDAECLEVWKNVDGFMSADPAFVPEADMIPVLSYEEAAELSYFGAKILHPNTVEPLKGSGIPLTVRNTFHPDREGTLITRKTDRTKTVVKSIAHNTDVGVLKIHSSGLGAKPGVLGAIATHLSGKGINITSVVTSQTCISLLLGREDMEKGYQEIRNIRPRPYVHLEKAGDLALVGIVGKGLAEKRGIAAQVFTAVAESGVNIEMISMGPSRVAYYFMVKEHDLKPALRAVHRSFFG
ncbi:MAG: aspartate kinase [Deltaproteobacteria bacterium]|nr:aspartate kinase [Deltaproteobacteria bacterium]MBW2120702.1 aspartate kinase [Deltaproteobacteria bacterium]